MTEETKRSGKPRVLALTGCTASGKSDLAMALARRLPLEIVCMDSMQIYRRLDIGAAKPSREDREEIPHHMLDLLEPTESYSVAEYVQAAERCFQEIWGRGKIPFLVGGTGLYLKSLSQGMNLGVQKSDPAIRARLEAVAMEPRGRERLHRMLQEKDAVAAAKLHPNDARRVIRALEVYELTGRPMSSTRQTKTERPYEVFSLALRMPRQELFDRIEKRINVMMARGLRREVEGLMESGVPADAQAMQGIGYKELVPAIRGDVSEEEAVRQIVLHTRHYAKRQETWLKGEEEIRWIDAGSGVFDELLYQAETFLQ